MTCAELFRLPPAAIADGAAGSAQWRVTRASLLFIAAGTVGYGAAFGLWRSPIQAAYSAMKMPTLFLSVVLASTTIDFMLARLLGVDATWHQVANVTLLGMAVTALLLGAASPVAAYFVLQVEAPTWGAPPPDASRLLPVYNRILIGHVAVIALAGLAGNLRSYAFLVALAGDRSRALRVMSAWLAVMGFVGAQLSWLLSPFLCKPTYPPHLLGREYFQQNFYERCWEALRNM